MNISERMVEQLSLGYFADPWHGPATTEVLMGVTAQQAGAKPLPTAHSIWEIVLHMIAWQEEVSSRLKGNDPKLPDRGDWPAILQNSEQAWTQAAAELETSLHGVMAEVRKMEDRQFDNLVGSERSRELGTGRSFFILVNGLVQHNAYHTGQIALLRKAI